jgi:hypothetical protein
MPLDRAHRLATVGALAHHLDLGFLFQESPQAFAGQRFVIDQENSDFHVAGKAALDSVWRSLGERSQNGSAPLSFSCGLRTGATFAGVLRGEKPKMELPLKIINPASK